MAQKIKVQDGVVVYSTPDPLTTNVAFDIKGALDVTKQVTIGDNPSASGQIQTPAGSVVDLIISTNTDGFTTGSIKLEPAIGGTIVLNGAVWPTTSPTPGNFLAVSAPNVLSYSLLVLGIVGSDILNNSQLNLLFPAAIPGQTVAGPTVVYQCVSSGQWRASAGALGYTPVNKAGDTMTGDLILNADPTTALGAVTKQYADAISAGVNVHEAARTSTTTTLAISSGGTIAYNNGSGGIGATLSTTGSFATIGGVSLNFGERVLVKDEATQAWNGVYTYSSSTLLTRATDFDGSPSSEVQAGDFLYVQEGSLIGTSWVQITTGTISIGSSSIVFTQFGGNTPQPLTINTQSSDYMIQLSDAYNTLIRITKATPAIVTIPNDSTINMPVGSSVLISWNGLGQVTIGFEVGVTVDTPDTYDIGKQFGKVVAIKVAANHWEIEGNLVPA
jgi:hypothetical protein